ncbi:hypothetical protein BpHYR1_020355 [Brachionus plicatilis]|uniref:Uncharacterized protein n=1 Tax=Brachionus plicatilis TaxID=10195 RepID=A0A3M7QIK8_BRAPC|nr:hypothetical protein BpHYR1_020355 [Brachionus plicatilis]
MHIKNSYLTKITFLQYLHPHRHIKTMGFLSKIVEVRLLTIIKLYINKKLPEQFRMAAPSNQLSYYVILLLALIILGIVGTTEMGIGLGHWIF